MRETIDENMEELSLVIAYISKVAQHKFNPWLDLGQGHEIARDRCLDNLRLLIDWLSYYRRIVKQSQTNEQSDEIVQTWGNVCRKLTTVIEHFELLKNNDLTASQTAVIHPLMINELCEQLNSLLQRYQRQQPETTEQKKEIQVFELLLVSLLASLDTIS